MAENEQQTAAELIKKYRKQRDMTQEELCEAAGISISTLKKYETGLRNPKPEQFKKIAEALGVTVNVFMPVEINDMSDLVSTLIQLDETVDLQWEFKRGANKNIIPETISISFSDYDINKQLADYLSNRKGKKKSETIDRLFTYMDLRDEQRINDYVEKYPDDIQALFSNLRNLIMKNAKKPSERIWAKLPSYYVGESFVRLIPFNDHINIEASAIFMHADELPGHKITPKGMLQLRPGDDIPTKVLKKIFAETLR